MNPLISVVLPSYNNLNSLKQCIWSLENQVFADFEVIVIVDGSTDNTESWLSGYHFSKMRFFVLPHNQGRVAARNMGIEKSVGEYILFLDSDAQASPQLLMSHFYSHRLHATAMVQGQIVTGFSENPTWKPSPWTDASQAFFDTGNVSVSRRKLIDVGGFDTDFNQYGWEDIDLGLRLKRKDCEAVFNPKALSYEQEYLPENYESLIENEKQRAAMAHLLYAKHPTLEVKMMTQIHTLGKLSGPLSYFITGSEPQLKTRMNWLIKQDKKHMALAFLRAYMNQKYLSFLS